MTILLFIAVLLITVIVHEYGHFIAAKKSGMLVEEFGFGIPPRLFSFKRGETKYSINALPIGGFVKIAGENGIDQSAPRERQFDSKPWYTKSMVLVAGVVFNFILAFLLFTVAYTIGLPGITPDGTPTVVSVVEGSPTQQAGISVGDTVQSFTVDGKEVSALETKEIKDAIQKTDGQIVISYTHNDLAQKATITPTQGDEGRLIGIAIEPIGIIKQPFVQSITNAWKHSISLTKNIISTIGVLIRGLFDGEPSTISLIGPVGLAQEVGNASTFGFTYLLAFIATISLNLAVLNIMPFPALDGGRLIVVWGEAITRRKFSPLTVGIIHGVGFLLLLILMVFLTVGDIKRII